MSYLSRTDFLNPSSTHWTGKKMFSSRDGFIKDQAARSAVASVGGLTLLQDLARAAKAVYEARENYISLTSEGSSTPDTGSETWPWGFQVMGDLFWGGVGVDLQKDEAWRGNHRYQYLSGTLLQFNPPQESDQLLKAKKVLDGHCPFKAGDLILSLRGTETMQEVLGAFTGTASIGSISFEGQNFGRTHSFYEAVAKTMLFEKGGEKISAVEAIRGLGAPHIYITGHSMGGSLAHIAALMLYLAIPKARITVVSFAAPRICHGLHTSSKLFQSYAQFLTSGRLKGLRVYNSYDGFHCLPGTNKSEGLINSELGALKSLFSLPSRKSLASTLRNAGMGLVLGFCEALLSISGAWVHPPLPTVSIKNNGQEIDDIAHSMDVFEHVFHHRTNQILG